MFDIFRDVLALLGGVGIVVIGLSKLLGGIMRDRIKEETRRETEMELEVHRNNLANRRVQADRFLNSQYEVYLELWKSIQGLRMAVDSLWQNATNGNIAALATQLRETRQNISNWSLFFEESHYGELDRLLKVLEEFEAGKARLISIRSAEEVPLYLHREIEHQIKQNMQYMEQFEGIVDSLRKSFQTRLSKGDERLTRPSSRSHTAPPSSAQPEVLR